MVNAGTCKGCGASIVWGKLRGKPHPLEARELTVITESGEQVRGRESHFARCPDAARFRAQARPGRFVPKRREAQPGEWHDKDQR